MSSESEPLILYLPSNFEFLHKKCRVCLGQKKNMIPIIHQIDINNQQVPFKDVLQACSVIKVEFNDNKPKLICNECKNKAIISYLFKTTCEKTDEKLERNKAENKSKMKFDKSILENNTERNYENRLKTVAVEIPDKSVKNKKQLDDITYILNSLECEKDNEVMEEQFFFDDEFERVVVKEEPLDYETTNDVNLDDASNSRDEFTCTLCETNYINEFELINHLNEEHLNVREEDDSNENVEYEEIIIQNDCVEGDSNFEVTLNVAERKKYNCNYCGKMFGRKFNLLRHLRTAKSCPAYVKNNEEEDANLKAKIEEEELENDSSFQEMLALIRRVKKPMVSTCIAGYSCPSCKKMFGRRFNVIRHLRTKKCLYDLKPNQEGGDSDEIVEKLIQSIRIIKRAKVSKQNLNCYTCPTCEKGFQRRFNVIRHLKTTKCYLSTEIKRKSAVEGTEIFICDVCRKGFAKETDLVEHMRLKHKFREDGAEEEVDLKHLNIMECRFCSFVAANKDKLWRHMSSEHEDLKAIKCNLCPKKFFEERRLKDHMTVHQKQKNHVCNFCGLAFSHSFNLKSHIRIHTGEKPYKCDVCELKFGQYNSLKSHKLTSHDLSYNYVCDLCGAPFKRLQEFRVHKMRHLKQKPYVCSLCKKAFVTSYELKVHLELHSKDKVFCCKICSKMFRCKSNYEEHVLRHEFMTL